MFLFFPKEGCEYLEGLFYFEAANSRNAYGLCREEMKVVEGIPCQNQHNQGMQA
jgi:hypothetical protein